MPGLPYPIASAQDTVAVTKVRAEQTFPQGSPTKLTLCSPTCDGICARLFCLSFNSQPFSSAGVAATLLNEKAVALHGGARNRAEWCERGNLAALTTCGSPPAARNFSSARNCPKRPTNGISRYKKNCHKQLSCDYDISGGPNLVCGRLLMTCELLETRGTYAHVDELIFVEHAEPGPTGPFIEAPRGPSNGPQNGDGRMQRWCLCCQSRSPGFLPPS